MNWCWVSLIVAVPNFITKSAAEAGSAPRVQARAVIAIAIRVKVADILVRRMAPMAVMVDIPPFCCPTAYEPICYHVNYNVSARPANHFASSVAHAVHQHLVLAAVDLDHRAVDEEC